MTAFERDGTEVEALLTDLYLERVLARHGTDDGPADADLDPALRRASDRLRRDLTRGRATPGRGRRQRRRCRHVSRPGHGPGRGVRPARGSGRHRPPRAAGPAAD